MCAFGHLPPKNSTVTLSAGVCDVSTTLVPFTSTVGTAAYAAQGTSNRNTVAQPKRLAHEGVERGAMMLAGCVCTPAPFIRRSKASLQQMTYIHDNGRDLDVRPMVHEQHSALVQCTVQ